MRIYYTTDIHGSTLCFKKFLNCGKFYSADAAIVGGDVTGKLIIPIVEKADGTYSCKHQGTQYDLIHIDAFSGDGIPTNLLTREALEIYLSRLSPKGVILFHVSNRNYELRPVVKSLSQELKLFGARKKKKKKEDLKPYQESTKCVVLTRDPDRLAPLLKRGWLMLGENDGLSTMPVWTDEHINILYPLIENIRARLKG